MLPYSLKIVWTVLSLSGLIACWTTLMAFARAIGAYWAFAMYCVACTIMQGIFCLGLIWKMNPYAMPRSFCIAQTIIIASAAYVMAAIACTVSAAISLTVLRPKVWTFTGRALLKWRRIFILPVIVFPTVATAVHIALIFKFNSVQPTNDFHCDDTRPEWVRFFGYAAVPFILAIPCTILSIKALIAVRKTNHSFSRAQLAVGADNLSSGLVDEGTRRSTVPTSSNSNSDDQQVLPPPRAVLPLFSRCRLSFLYRLEKSKRPASFGSSKRRTSSVSTTIPVFRVPVNVRTVRDNTQGPSTAVDKELDVLRPISGVHEYVFQEEKQDDRLQDRDARDELILMGNNEKKESVGRRGFDLDPSAVNVECHLEENEVPYTSISHPPRWAGMQGMTGSRWPPPNLIPAFWRILIFQVAFTVIQVLTCISTIIDVASHRTHPTPFGMQHIALLLSAWGPFIIFGHLPSVRRNVFWRRS